MAFSPWDHEQLYTTEWLTHTHIPTRAQIYISKYFLKPLIVIPRILIFVIYLCAMASHCDSIWISLVINETQHLFMIIGHLDFLLFCAMFIQFFFHGCPSPSTPGSAHLSYWFVGIFTYSLFVCFVHFKYHLPFCHLSFSSMISFDFNTVQVTIFFYGSAFFLFLIEEIFFYLKETKIVSYIILSKLITFGFHM